MHDRKHFCYLGKAWGRIELSMIVTYFQCLTLRVRSGHLSNALTRSWLTEKLVSPPYQSQSVADSFTYYKNTLQWPHFGPTVTSIANLSAQRWSNGVSDNSLQIGSTSAWRSAPATHRTAFLQRVRRRCFWNSGIFGMHATALYSRSGWITDKKNDLLACRVSCRDDLLSAPILRATFECTASTWADHVRLLSMITPGTREHDTIATCLPWQ